MKHARSIWLAFLTCSAVVAAAMAVITHHALSLEKAGLQAAGEAQLGEKVRLALWRMDTEAAAMLFAENNRAPSDFRNFPHPRLLNYPVAGGTDEMQQSTGPPPSPLLANMPDYAILHFEINENGRVESPQVPAYPSPASVSQHSLSAQQLAACAVALARLRTLLGLEENRRTASFNQNLSMAVAAANTVFPGLSNEAALTANAPETDVAPPPQLPALKKPAAATSNRGQDAAMNEYNSRQAIVQKAVRSNSLNAGSQPFDASTQSMPARPALPAQVTPFKALWLEGELFLVRSVVDGGTSRVQGVWLRTSTLAAALLGTLRDLLPNATLIPFQPFVFTPDNVLQPANAAKHATLSDLAKSFTVKAGSYERAPLALVTLPWQLVPGEEVMPGAPAWSPLHTLLSVTWGCVVLAMAAVAVLLGGVVALSERRASFVSSVTHELRTPLTTFKLYSEMLAEDMVPEPEQRKAYLMTLQNEASRLTHLVENVLAYSRIERGTARARIEHSSVASLAERLVPRLTEHAAAAALQLTCDVPDSLSGIRLSLDVTAVEQILFNLVDNACKYAASDERQEMLELSFARVNNTLQIRLRDYGPGIPAAARRDVFKPFHKSAQQAAASKPGVGLGLSLSRRLARALGGNLSLDCLTKNGTCFLLELPISLT